MHEFALVAGFFSEGRERARNNSLDVRMKYLREVPEVNSRFVCCFGSFEILDEQTLWLN